MRAAGTRLRSRVRQRGATSVLFAIVLAGILGGVIAVVVDGGHLFEVRSELQNAADSAALAGVLDLDGMMSQYPVAVSDAQKYAAANDANGAPVQVPPTDITLGHFDLATHTFAPMISPAYEVNAVKVIARRSAATGNAVGTYFAPLIGITQEDVTATAVGVGGGPSQACGFPVAIAACSIFDAAGNLMCGQNLCFGPSNAGCDAALTAFTQGNPSVPDVNCAFAKALGVPPSLCPKNCDCSTPCMSSSTSTQVYINNGNSLSQSDVDDVTWALNNSPNGLYVTAPIFDNGQPTGCTAPGSSALNQLWTPVGYVSLHILSASGCPNGGGGKCIETQIDCSQTSIMPGGGNLYGLPTTIVFLGQ